ncbi:ubiquitin-conjugating enzyme E2 T-like [Tubulanus polymorphus]|uniref:ubiquitin-conjugating enzyme E2 T-like n=1 Tax=Tubulanus polymorphus TaxID=672921 RepID=UPI003DA3B035
MAARLGRLRKEVKMLETDPPPGISCWVKKNKSDEMEAQLIGSDGTPYADGLFGLEIQIPDRYPFEPPKVRFTTPVYHPNIDNGGRICLDSLKMPPKGSWKPSLNISTILTSIQLLLSEPNPDDPLMADIAHEFRFDREKFNTKAKEYTKRYASQVKDKENEAIS